MVRLNFCDLKYSEWGQGLLIFQSRGWDLNYVPYISTPARLGCTRVGNPGADKYQPLAAGSASALITPG